MSDTVMVVVGLVGWVAVGGLVAAHPQCVERERVVVGGGALVFHPAANHPQLHVLRADERS